MYFSILWKVVFLQSNVLYRLLISFLLISPLQPVLYSYFRSTCSWRVRIGEYCIYTWTLLHFVLAKYFEITDVKIWTFVSCDFLFPVLLLDSCISANIVHTYTLIFLILKWYLIHTDCIALCSPSVFLHVTSGSARWIHRLTKLESRGPDNQSGLQFNIGNPLILC